MSYRCKRHKNFPFEPKKAALLVIDMQGYFTKPSSKAYVTGSAKVIEQINILIDAFNKLGRPVIFTRHLDINKKSLMCRWWRGSISPKDPLSKLDERLNTSGGTILIKHHYDSFMGTRLQAMLKKWKCSQMVIAGVVTYLCVETTARSAFMRDIVPFVVEDATAAHTKKHHVSALFNLARGFAVPVTTRELLPLK